MFVDDTQSVTELGEKVIEFMVDNSFECPDKCREGVQFRRDTIECLHQKFMSETLIECSLSAFSRYVPSNIIKPKPTDWGTSLCKICLNPELKVEAINESGVDLNYLLSMTNDELRIWSDARKADDIITYKEWQSEAVEKKKSAKVKDDQSKDVTVKTKTYRSVKVVITQKKKIFYEK